MKKLFEKKEIVEEKKESKVKSISKMLEEMGGKKKTPEILTFRFRKLWKISKNKVLS